jgi:hypothetical protein
MNPWLERLYKESSTSVLSPGHLRGQSREHGYEDDRCVLGGSAKAPFSPRGVHVFTGVFRDQACR